MGCQYNFKVGREDGDGRVHVHYEENELYIYQRLEREKRCGKVEKIDDHTSRFYAEVYDASELVPWIRTFICRITEIHFSNKILEVQFKRDIQKCMNYTIWKAVKNNDIP